MYNLITFQSKNHDFRKHGVFSSVIVQQEAFHFQHQINTEKMFVQLSRIAV